MPKPLRSVANGDIVAEELIGPVVIEGTPWKVYAASIGIIARDDCDVRNISSVGEREGREKDGEEKECYPMIISLSPSTPWPTVGLR